MSYILDALKKSEKERSLGNVPTLGAAGQDEERRVPLKWFVMTVVVLALAVLLAGGWLLWSSRTPQGPAGGKAAESAPKPPAPAAAQTAAGAGKDEVQVVPSARPVPVSELDHSVRSRLPEIRINVLSYSESSEKRFVMIGQDIFKEGEEVSAGVFVDEIRNSDVVFRFENVSFVLEP